METNLITEAAAKILRECKAFLETDVQTVTINTEVEYNGAAELIMQLKAKRKFLDETRKVEKAPWYDHATKVDATFQPLIKTFDEKVSLIETAGRNFRRKQEEIAAAEQKRLDEENEAARRKIMDSAASKQEKAKELRAMADKFETEGKLDEAQKCRDRAAGYDERAEAKVEQAQQRVAPIVQAAVPPAKRGGFNTRTTYKAKIVKMPALMGYLSAAVPPAVEAVIQQWADAQARASQGAPSTIPGVEFLKI